MADISVALELDDKQYTQALKRAGQEGDKFAKETTKNVEQTEKAFAGLGKVVAGIGFGALITQSIQLGKQLDSISRATGVAIKNVKGLQDAFTAAGGSADKASDGLTDLVKNIGDAAANGGELATAFRTVGVSLTDLATLSEQDILRKVIAGLAKIPDAATRSAVGMKIMGEAIKGVDLTKVNESYDAYSEKAAKIEKSAKAAAEAQKNLAAAYTNVQTGVMMGIEPLTEMIAKLTENTAVIADMVKLLTELALVVGGAFAFSKLLSGFDSVVRAMSAAQLASGGFIKGLSNAGGLMGELGIGLRYLGQAFNLTTAATVKSYTGIGIMRQIVTSLLGAFSRLIPIIALAYAAFNILNQGVKMFTGTSITEWVDKQIQSLTWLTEGYKKLKEALGFGEIDTGDDGSYARKEAARAEAVKQTTEENKRLLGVLQKQRDELDKSIASYQNQIKSVQDKIQYERELIGLSEDQKELKQTAFEAEKAYLTEIAALQEKLNASDTTPEEKEQIAKAIQQITQAYEQQLQVLPDLVKAKQAEESANRKSIELLNERLRIEEQIRRVQDDMASMTMSEIEKKEYDIKRAAEERARAYIAAEEARTGIKMSSSDKDKIIKEYIAGTEELIQATKKSYDQSKMWSTGWKQAMNDYVRAASNGAQRARDLFGKSMKGMEDLLVNFAKTGKFEWKQFVASMIEELLRAQIQMLFAKLFMGADDAMEEGKKTLGGLAGAAGAAAGSTAEEGAVEGAKTFWETVTDIAKTAWEGVSSVFTSIGEMLHSAWETVASIMSSGASFIGSVFESIGTGLGSIGEWVIGIFGQAGQFVSQMLTAGGEWVFNAFQNVGGLMDTAGNMLYNIFGGVGDFIASGGQFILNTLGDMGSMIYSAGGFVTDMLSAIGSDLGSVGSSLISVLGDVIGSIGSMMGGGGGGGGWIGTAISLVGSLFGGFFADGGKLQSGKWGIVGEEGPEIIKGPAEIVPLKPVNDSGTGEMSTSSVQTAAPTATYVTYNINAVDAMSFKQLLAQDPGYLYGLTLVGAKSVPSRR